MARIDTDEEYENRMDGGQPDNSDYELARRNNAGQPSGRFDAGSQTFVPDGWESALRDQETARQRKFFGDVIGGRRAAMDEIGEVADTDRRMRAMVQLDLNNYMAGAVRYSDGGVLPDSVRNFINRRMTEKYGQYGLRFDGQSTGILPGTGFSQDGSYVFRLGNGTDPRGNAMTQDQVLDGRQLHSLMYMNRESFGADAIEKSRQTLRGNGLSSKEIAALEQDPISDDIRRSIEADTRFTDRKASRERMARPSMNADAMRARGYFGDGSAGGRNIGGTTDGKAASRLFGRGGDNRSRISVFGTGGAGTGYTVRNYNGHTGEDTGFVDDSIRQARTAELANGSWSVAMSGNRRVSDATTDNDGKRVEAQYEDGKLYRNSKTGEEVWVPEGSSLRQVMANAAGTEKGRRGSSLSFDERKQLQDERIRAQQEQHKADQDALTGRSEQSRKEREMRERGRLLYGELKSLTSGGRIKDKDRYKKVLDEIRKLYGDDDEGSQATPGKGHNSGGSLNLDGIKPGDVAELRKRMDAAPEGTEATLDGETRVKRNGEWVKK